MDRLAELRSEPRCIPGAYVTNYVDGLIDLILATQPKTVLEIGSDRGVSTECFLLLCDHVTAVDPWEDDHYKPHYQEFLKRCGKYKNLTVLRARSPDALEQFKPRSFDLVYIDGDHEVEGVMKDIWAAKRVAKKWIAGHDIILPGVFAAVDTVFGKDNIKRFSDTSWLAYA